MLMFKNNKFSFAKMIIIKHNINHIMCTHVLYKIDKQKND